MKRNRYFLTMVALGAITFGLTFLTTTVALSGALPQPPSPERISLLDVSFDGWKYVAYREGKEVTAQIILDDTSLAGLEKFRAANRVLANSITPNMKTLPASVVFTQPQPVPEFITWIDKHQVQVGTFQLRAIDGNGDRITLFSTPDGNHTISIEPLQPLLEWIQKQTGAVKVLGVISADIMLPASNYNDLAADSAVYLVDVTPAYADKHLRQYLPAVLQADDLLAISSYPVYWYLEDNQLVPEWRSVR